jgi:hypothetical protein
MKVLPTPQAWRGHTRQNRGRPYWQAWEPAVAAFSSSRVLLLACRYQVSNPVRVDTRVTAAPRFCCSHSRLQASATNLHDKAGPVNTSTPGSCRAAELATLRPFDVVRSGAWQRYLGIEPGAVRWSGLRSARGGDCVRHRWYRASRSQRDFQRRLSDRLCACWLACANPLRAAIELGWACRSFSVAPLSRRSEPNSTKM